MEVFRIAYSSNIGAGKSTQTQAAVQEPYKKMLLGLISGNSSFPSIIQDYPERFEYEDLFKLYSEKPKEYALTFQLMILFSSLEMEERINAVGGIALIDRPFCEHRYVFGEARFRRGDINTHNFKAYDLVYQLLAEKVPPPDVYVRLKASIPSLQERIRVRGRPEEQYLVTDPTYLHLLEECSNELFAKYVKQPVIDISTDGMKVSAEGELDHNFLKASFEQTVREIKVLDLPKLRRR